MQRGVGRSPDYFLALSALSRLYGSLLTLSRAIPNYTETTDSSQILAPSIYGLVYMKTVATFPQTIFFMSVGCVAVSFILLSLVRLPQENHENTVDIEEQELILNDGCESRHTRDAEGTIVDLADTGGIKNPAAAAASGSAI